MKYLFSLGKNPSLSLAELLAVFGDEKVTLINNKLALLDIKEIDSGEIIKGLGGTIKIASLEKTISKPEDLKESCLDLIKQRSSGQSGKIKFGISPYSKNLKGFSRLGFEIKKELKKEGINSRLVTSKEKILSSVVVETNKLTQSGIEIVLAKHQNEILLGKTLAVQDFRNLSFRDYNRPARDSHSGMLPPKLAQILINLASLQKKELKLLDPFCGSGTILTESVLMGYKNIIGTDSSNKAIEDSKTNLKWVQDNYELNDVNCDLKKIRVEELSRFFKKESIDIMVTEPYLGPQRGKIQIKKVVQELETLYSKALEEFSQVLKKGGRIAIIWPVFENGTRMIDPNIGQLKLVPLLKKDFEKDQSLNITKRQTIIYFREGQKIHREVVVLQK